MSASLILQQDHISRDGTPPPTSNQIPSIIHHIQELGIEDDEQQLRDFFDRTLSDDHNVRQFSGVMSYAIWSNKVRLVEELLHRKLPLSPLYVVEAVKARAKGVLEMFFHHGWDINRKMGEMEPPVLANALGDWNMTTWLLDHGADPNARCYIDYTPLSYAVTYADLPIIDLLLHRGGDVNKGQLVHNAIYRESTTLQVVKGLIDRGAPLNTLMYQDDLASRCMFPFMVETPLHTAVALKREDVIRYLISKGADVSIQNSKGQTVLQCADEHTREIIQEIQSSSVFQASVIFKHLEYAFGWIVPGSGAGPGRTQDFRSLTAARLGRLNG